MAEGRLPKIALKWMPKQKRARGRPKRNWMESIRKAMNETNLNEGQWEDRKQWSLGVELRRTMLLYPIYSIHIKYFEFKTKSKVPFSPAYPAAQKAKLYFIAFVTSYLV